MIHWPRASQKVGGREAVKIQNPKGEVVTSGKAENLTPSMMGTEACAHTSDDYQPSPSQATPKSIKPSIRIEKLLGQAL